MATNITLQVNVVNSGDTIQLPIAGTPIYVTINWGDSSSPQTYTSQGPSYLYVNSGTYTITISGTFTNLNATAANNNYKNGLVSL